MNQSVTKYAPKGRTFSKSASLVSRVAVCAGINSVGNKEYVSRMYDDLGVLVTSVTLTHLSKFDNTKTRKQAHEKLPRIKRKRSATKKQKLTDQLTAEVESRKRHEDYGSGIAVLPPEAATVTATTKNKRSTTARGPRRCGACGEMGHHRDNSVCVKYRRCSTVLLASDEADGKTSFKYCTYTRAHVYLTMCVMMLKTGVIRRAYVMSSRLGRPPRLESRLWRRSRRINELARN